MVKEISFSDEPAELDVLNHTEIYYGLAELISTAKKPLILAIIGEWGTGKTTLVNQTMDILENQFTILNYNAWSHNKGMSLLKGLILHLKRELGESIPNKRDTFKKLIKSPITSSTVRGLGSVVGGTKGAIFNFIAKLIENHQEANKSDDDSVEDFIDDFKSITESFYALEKPLLVFVDDLDRCSPIDALDLIDDIKVYLTIEAQIVFIVALDKKTLSMGLKSKYGADSEISVDDYLQKIFSYTLNMPKIESLNLFIGNLLSDFDHKKEDYDLTDIPEEYIQKYDITNMRSIKRIIRRYLFILPTNINDYLRKAGLKEDSNITSLVDMLGRFVFIMCILYELYPDIFESFIHRENILKQIPSDQNNADQPSHIIAEYLLWKGNYKELKVGDSAGKYIQEHPILNKILKDLVAANYLKGATQEDYRQSNLTIYHAVRLGLPLIK
jgi:hypothetical protein